MSQNWEIKFTSGERAKITADGMQIIDGVIVFYKENLFDKGNSVIAAFPTNQVIYAFKENEVEIIDKN